MQKELLPKVVRRIINEIGVEYIPTEITNFKFIVSDDDCNLTLGVLEGERTYLLGDRVDIAADTCGYISPGIKTPGKGWITEIRTDTMKSFYGVQMDNGEFGFVKSARIKSILSA